MIVVATVNMSRKPTVVIYTGVKSTGFRWEISYIQTIFFFFSEMDREKEQIKRTVLEPRSIKREL